ncbi:MAG TPA: uroporphyrinogen-III C-methyltransferase [Sphingobium sp.]
MPTMSRSPLVPHAARPATGTVFLVGAGPGDPDLLTVRAARLIAQAEVIVHDGLVGEGVMALASDKAELISVAKKRDRHSVPQEGINAILVEHALAGRNVVRLKGGDPFIFGRGGEELEACRVAGVPVEVVPGISAAMGCAAAANLPLTHRDIASAVTFVAGQCKGLSDQNWAGLAGAGRTLVIYMGVATADDIADKLMADGLSPDTPVVVLENGTLPEQRALRTLLADLGDMVHREQVRSPAVIVVGNVAGLADASDKLGSRAGALQMLDSLKGQEGLL